MEKKLTRLPSEAVLGGVAAGMSDYFGVDRTIIRVLWVVALLLPIPPNFFWTTIVYIILWVALPEGTPLNTPANPYDRPPGTEPADDPRFASAASGYSAAGSTGSGIFSNGSDPDRSIKIIGVILLGVGAILLLDELPYWYRVREYIWPVALIIAGAFLLLRQRDKEQSNGSSLNTPPPPTAPFTPNDPFSPVDPDPVPYRPFDTPSIDPDRPADPDDETDPSGNHPQVK
jgi:phage shock protein C